MVIVPEDWRPDSDFRQPGSGDTDRNTRDFTTVQIDGSRVRPRIPLRTGNNVEVTSIRAAEADTGAHGIRNRNVLPQAAIGFEHSHPGTTTGQSHPYRTIL